MIRLYALIAMAAIQLAADDRPVNRVASTEWDNVLPQVADGSGWSTRIMLVNLDTVAAPYTLYFYDDDGAPWSLALKGSASGPASSLSGMIPVGGSVFLETAAAGSKLGQGWAYLSTQKWISGMAVFKAAWLPTNDAEAVVPLTSEVDVDFFMPFDNRDGYVTSIALVNPSPTTTANVTAQFRNPDGTVISEQIIPLGPRKHKAFETTNEFPVTQGKHGVIEFKVAGGQAAASALGLLFSPRNTFTSIHTVSLDPYLVP